MYSQEGRRWWLEEVEAMFWQCWWPEYELGWPLLVDWIAEGSIYKADMKCEEISELPTPQHEIIILREKERDFFFLFFFLNLHII